MSSEDLSPLEAEASTWGVQLTFEDVLGNHQRAPKRTLEMITESIRSRAQGRSGGPLVVVLGEDDEAPAGPWEIETEAGEIIHGNNEYVGARAGLGYHKLRTGGLERDLIVAPSRCYDPPTNAWGIALQLYSGRTSNSWGMGDLADLAGFGAAASNRGADVLMINPLHASLPATPQEASPYFPSSRSFGNPIYLSVADLVAGADADEMREAAAELNKTELIDRDGVWRLKDGVLRSAWKPFSRHAALDAYIAERGNPLRRYATFCALVDRHGRHWPTWPHELRHPASPAVARFAAENEDLVRFHSWSQMLFDAQLASAGQKIDLLADIAVGVDPNGADAWMMQDDLALDMRVGAPPDEFNSQGQNWSVPPFDPWSLKASCYEPFRQMIRANARSAKGIRIDHVMALFRLYWIPEGAGAGEGAYVRYPARDMLAVLALESQRAGCFVVGEDLGTVEGYMRHDLWQRQVLSYKVMWFEDCPTGEYPPNSMASVTTHDLPTVAGVWSGRDYQNQLDLELDPRPEANEGLVNKLRTWTEGRDSVEDAVVAVHERLAEAGSCLVTATAEDLLEVEGRPNYPGTVRQWPNWSLPMPVALDAVLDQPAAKRITESLENARKG